MADAGAGPVGPEAVAYLQRTAGNAAVGSLLGWAEPAPDAVLAGAGRPLDESVRAEMEASLDADFSTVRVHDDASARASAHALGARAYTVGEDIVVGDGGADRRTMAHELTHVVQQRSGPVDGTPTAGGFSVSDPGDRFERAAEATAGAIGGGTGRAAETVRPGTGAGATAQRAPTDEEIPDIPVEDLPGRIPDVSPEDLPRAPGASTGGKPIPVVSPEDLPQLIELPDVVIAGRADAGGPAAGSGQVAAEKAPHMVTLTAPINRPNAPETGGSEGGPAPHMVTLTAPINRPNAPETAVGAPSTTLPAVGGPTSMAGGQPASQGAIVTALWTSAVVGPIRTAASAAAGDKPDYKSAVGSLRQAKDTVVTVIGSLPDGDARIARAGALLTAIELCIEGAARRANEPGDLPANIGSVIGAVADDATSFGSALRGA